jgi:hypothetical protein
MELKHIEKKFERIGARLKIRDLTDSRRARAGWYTLDVAHDRQGEHFELGVEDPAVRFEVIHADRDGRHLLLQADSRQDPVRDHKQSSTWRKFLCGHDERHWFVAGVDSRCTNVNQAKESLKPAEVAEAQVRHRVKRKNRNRRRNAGFVRQGEWFFVPAPYIGPAADVVLRKEPLRRGGGKPHLVEYLYRDGGTTVYVCRKYPNGLTHDRYRQLIKDDPGAKHYAWRVMRLNPQVYVKGYVKHPDHKTIHLPGWHRVFTNGEIFSEQVVFLD